MEGHWYDDKSFDLSRTGHSVALVRTLFNPDNNYSRSDDVWVARSDGSAASQITFDGAPKCIHLVGLRATDCLRERRGDRNVQIRRQRPQAPDELRRLGVITRSLAPTDSTTLVFERADDIYKIDASTARLLNDSSVSTARNPSGCPNGKQIAFIQRPHLRGFDRKSISATMQRERLSVRRLDLHHRLWTSGHRLASDPRPQRGDYKNADQFCKAEQAFWGDQFACATGAATTPTGMRERP